LLSQYKEPAALDTIISALGDEDADVSLAASDALVDMQGDAVVKALFQQLAPKVEVDVQGGALRTVALRADLATIPLLQKAMPAIHPQLQELAADVLKKLEARAKALAAKGKQES
jgi:HEAT repeat protein